jgi:periplasmic protein TonB
MPRHSHITKYFITSFALHALLVVAALYLIKPALTELPFTPVRIVDLPQQESRQLPPLQRPEPVRPTPERPAPVPPAPPVPQRVIPEKPMPPSAVPMPKKFGESEELSLPKTSPGTGVPEGAEQGKETGKTGLMQTYKEPGKAGQATPNKGGPLPFLSQNDIDELARKGMPQKQPGDDSVTLDTDEFKLMSYNRWLKIKIESMLKYPELAAASGYSGTLYIKFDINKDGSLGGLDILQSSGYKILDDEALRAIRASAPFQPLPDEWKMSRYSIRAAVIFILGGSYIR